MADTNPTPAEIEAQAEAILFGTVSQPMFAQKLASAYGISPRTEDEIGRMQSTALGINTVTSGVAAALLDQSPDLTKQAMDAFFHGPTSTRAVSAASSARVKSASAVLASAEIRDAALAWRLTQQQPGT